MPEETSQSFTWSVHPARERKGSAAAAVLAVVALAAAAAVFGEHPGWGILGAAVLVIALNRFFFPSRFSIDEKGLTARYPLAERRILWVDVRRFVGGESGAFLSRRARASWLDGSGGLEIPFGRHGDGVGRRIRQHLGQKDAACAG